MFAALLISSLRFSYHDLKTHRILNRDILLALSLFFGVTLLTHNEIFVKSSLVTAIFGALVAVVFGVGMGDVKLLTLFTLFFIPLTFETARLLFGFLIGSSITVLGLLIKYKSVKIAVPLAPSICLGVIYSASFS
ncbi:MAG: hypothetical protein RLZZ73_250 [Actinomycetota bacterium]